MHPAFVALALAPLRHTMLYGWDMIIACPACATRYVVPDSAIGIDGRTVRCAKCKHNWFQDGPTIAVPPVAAPAPPPPPPPSVAQPQTAPEAAAQASDWDWNTASKGDAVAPIPPADAPEPAPEPAPAAPVQPAREEPVPVPPVYAEPSYRGGYADAGGASRFDHQPLLAPRRNPAKMWTMAAALFATVAIAAIGATAWYGLPNWMPFARPIFAEDQPGLKLEFPVREQQRYQLPNGTWYFSANGMVTNTSQSARSVPTILIVLRDSQGRIVHRAEVRSPKRVLAPGESADINEALVPVPKAGVRVEFGWKPS